MTVVIAGKPGLHELRKRIRQRRASWQWYLFILLGIPALVMLGIISFKSPHSRGASARRMPLIN
jgi:hypothetical protein